MRTPPFLMGAGLLFWGWQSDLLPVAAAMAVGLESSRFIKARWDMTDAEVSRIWNFCSLLGLVALVFAFTSNEGPANFGKLFEDPTMQSGRLAGNSSTLAAIALIRWLPLVFFFFVVAQVFSSRADFPMETISPFLRYRRKQLLKQRRPAPRTFHFNAVWPYFAMCLFAASAHAPAEAGDKTFFWGLCGLIAWALWSQRPQGADKYVWLGLLVGVIASGFFGQRGVGALSRLYDLADNYNPQWLAHFIRSNTDPEQSRTAIGHIGQMKQSSEIVMRVIPVNGVGVPTYLREATYRSYFSPVWYVGDKAHDFSGVAETPVNSGHWIFQADKTNHSQVNISCYLNGVNQKDGNPQGLLPLPVDCDHLDHLPAYALQNNGVGAVLAEGPGLVMFNASYGGGAALDAPPGTNDYEVPKEERTALAAVAAALPLAHVSSDAQKILQISHYFAANYQYSLWQGNPKIAGTNETALSRFLLQTHSGHCEYFATATVLLLRQMQIPARYAVGYYVHEAVGKHYVVRERDAHAWCMVWDAKAQAWQTLDTTPASWVETEGRRTPPWQFLSDLFSWLHYQFSKFRWGQSHLRPYLLITLVPALGYFLYQIIFHRRRQKTQVAGTTLRTVHRPGLDSEFYLLEQKLARRGLPRRSDESLTDWLLQVADDPAVANQREPLRQLLRLHYRHRFDPQGLPPAEREELRRQARACLEMIP